MKARSKGVYVGVGFDFVVIMFSFALVGFDVFVGAGVFLVVLVCGHQLFCPILINFLLNQKFGFSCPPRKRGFV